MKKIMISVGALILVSALFLFIYSKYKSGYQLISPKRGPVVEAIYGIGTVNARHIYQVKVGVTSSIKKLFVREGDDVRTNSPLVQLDDMRILNAPFSGTITSVPFNEGEIVYPQSNILTLSDLKDRFVEVSLEQQGVMRVKKGQSVKMSCESLRGEILEGKVTQVFPRNGEFVVHIEVPDLPEVILPGMTADVVIEVGHVENALLIPITALSAGKLTVLRNGKHEKINVKVGVVDSEWAEIIEGGLEPSDQIVIKARQ